MFASWTLGRAFGIPLRLHWSFLLLPLWIVLTQGSLGNWAEAGFQVALVLAMFVCVLLHELGHALAARGFGVGTRDITLYPIGGVASLERIPEKPSQELAIAVAGPAVNVVIAGVLALALALGSLFLPGFAAVTWGGQFVFLLTLLNLGMVVFNLIPAFPLDGGRVLRATLAWPLGRLSATRVAAWLGSVLAVVLGLVGVFYLNNPFLLIIALFVYSAAQQELRVVEYVEQARRCQARQFDFFSGMEGESREKMTESRPFAGLHQTMWVWDGRNERWHRM